MNATRNGLASVVGRILRPDGGVGPGGVELVVPIALTLLLALGAFSGCAGGTAADDTLPALATIESSPPGEHADPPVVEPATEIQTRVEDAGAGAPFASANRAAQAPTNGAPSVASSPHQPGPRRGAAAAVTVHNALTVEELLEQGLYAAGVSPVHLALRGTAGADTVRCAWRGIARTAAQREGAIRYWLRLDAADAIPSVAYVEALFAVTLDTLNPEYRETVTSNFLAIARGGLSEEYLFLTCFADYTVSNYLLGTGPAAVTVTFDKRGEAASYELYRREHDAGTFGSDPLQSRGDYEASLQDLVVAAEHALVAEIGGRERIVFLAPMGAHNAIAFEAWQAVAHWDVVTETDGTVNAVRVGAPEGDPEHTQTLADLSSRITTAAGSDAHASTRIANVSGLQGYYQTIGAYEDITPDDGQTTTFTPAQPPAAPACTNGTAVTTPNDNRGLVRDCETLLAAKDGLRGTATLDWGTGTAVSDWEGVTTGGTPSRVTGLNLSSNSLTGSIPAELGQLFELTTLDLSSNQITGDIPRELGWLTNLTELRLSGNQLTGCIPVALKDVATNDLSALNLLYCEPPAPTNLSAGTPGEASVVLSWDAVTNAGKYWVEYRTGDPAAWITDDDTIAGATHTVDELQCETSYELRVSAYGSGTTYAAAWGEPSTKLTTETGTCTPPAFGAESYAFTVSALAAVEATVGTVTATDAEGSAVTYAITDGNMDASDVEVFAIDATSGAITVAGTLAQADAPYTLTVSATDVGGGTATVAVTVRLTDLDYDLDDDGLLEVAHLAQLHAIRWDLDGDGTSSDPGYVLAFSGALAGMGCPATGCTGYELAKALDLDTDASGAVDAADDYWNGGSGWEPIGTTAATFTATFDGNGHTIANLFIDRSTTDRVGLFGVMGATAVVRNVRLSAVDATGNDDVGGLVGHSEGTVTASAAAGAVAGNEDVGGLVGRNTGTVAASYATGTIVGAGRSSGLDFLGGLVGRNDSDGSIVTSYAKVDLVGDDYTGGLVGQNHGTISASYATGTVRGDHHMGGLVGRNYGTITASYATGAPSGSHTLGGLTGQDTGGGTVTTSYWDTVTSGRTSGGGGVGQTTGELQTPTGYAGIYADWDVNVDDVTGGDAPWHFGTSGQYPALRVDFNGDGTATWQEFGDQRPIVAPEFEEPSYAFEVGEGSAVNTVVGMVTTIDGGGGAATYAIMAGTGYGTFAIGGTSGAITVIGELEQATTPSYALTVTASDPQGRTSTVLVTITVTEFVMDYDRDDDGLIEVTDLAQLHAIRWDLDGDGSATDAGYADAFPDAPTGMGCPATGCTGYELMADLDFDTDRSGAVGAGDDYWNDEAGWEPIGSRASPFAAVFDGNGHTIANLIVDRGSTDQIGLFGSTGSGSAIRHVGLTEVNVMGAAYVGGLVGWNEGSITGSYVTGEVEGTGLDTGGLVGWNAGRITACYATATVTGSDLDAGGLAGGGNGPIKASYASGAVTGAGRSGGLVGFNGGAITVSYARGAVTGTATPTGGLVAFRHGQVTASYWDTTTSGQTTSAGGTGKTTSELQAPTSYSGIYADWNVDIDGEAGNDDPWDFGTESQYPVLQVDFDGDGTATWKEFGDQRSVSPSNSPPVFAEGEATTRAADENTAAGEDIGDAVAATDADGDTLTYTLGGTDANDFVLDTATGQLRTQAALDYETQAEHVVAIEVSDGNGGNATITVTITVGDVVDTPPPAPANLAATPAATSVEVSWDAVAGAAKYRVEYRVSGTDNWTTDTDTLTTTTHSVHPLACGTARRFRVSAYGDGVAHIADWGDASTPVTAATTACALPEFGAPSYEFTVSERAAIDTEVGTVTATDPGGAAVTYAITEGNEAGAFAIDEATGTLTVTAALDYLTTPEYELTVAAAGASGTATVTVTITVTGVACANGMVIDDPGSHAQLVADCRVLLAAVEGLEGNSEIEGGGTVNWSEFVELEQWEGVTTGGTPSRVTGLDLSEKSLGGTIPPELGSLTALTTLDLSSNRLTGAIPAELRGLTSLTTLSLSGNNFSGCLPADLRSLAVAIDARGGAQDLAQLALAYCDATAPPAPTALSASATSATSVTLTWVGATDVGTLTYRIGYRVAGSGAEWTVDADNLTAATHEVDGLTCGTAYEFSVSAAGDGVHALTDWGAWAAAASASTSACLEPCSSLAVVNATLTKIAADTLRASWEYGDDCAGIEPVWHYIKHVQEYADGTREERETQSSAGSPRELSVDLTHWTSGSPLVRFTWTHLEVKLDPDSDDRLSVTFDPVPSVGFNQPPAFGQDRYAFSIVEDAAVDAPVGSVSATDTDTGNTVSYTITAGNTGGAFAIDAGSGALAVATALDYETIDAYTLTVQADDGHGGQDTATVAVTVTDVVEDPPAAPTNLTAVVNDDGSITLTWDAPADDSVIGYQILRRRPTEGEDVLLVYVENTDSTATTFTDTNVTAGVRHVYRVKAINAHGLSERSNFTRATP